MVEYFKRPNAADSFFFESNFFGEQNMLEKENLVGYIFIFDLIKATFAI